jgi:LmbE family N-acetylglucosaminyl deacetylase
VRSKELACAVQTLGGKSLAFLDHKDPLVGEDDQLHPYTTDLDGLTQQVLTYIQLNQPKAVITHGSNGEYGHPAHVLTHQAARDAICSMNGGVPWLYTISPKFPDHPRPRLANQDNPAHLVIDVSSAMDQKEAAALCHRTQNALFVRRSSKKAGRKLNVREVLMRIEGLHRACPIAMGTQEDPLAVLLQPWTI